ncbi:hypothetical protein BH24BAC1_BH24BAC1_04990 [soil metagenome]
MALRNILLLLFLPVWLFPLYGWAQVTGCTDPQATNFNAQATQNDGNCLYPETAYRLLPKVSPLPEVIRETSGLAFDGTRLWTHNDSGHSNTLYALDTLSGQVRQTVTVSNATNIDWEDLAFDGTFLYVGDFGNNAGNRRDLAIYKIRLSDIGSAATVSVPSEKISFSYPDQTDFASAPLNTSFDCEAFFFHRNLLHLFTKNWRTKHTSHYTVPTGAGPQVASLVETFPANGLITGADITATGEIALIGYDNTGSAPTFLWLLFDYPDNLFFGGNKRRIELGSALEAGQIEGITFRQGASGYISSERFTVSGILVQPAKLYAFQFGQWLTRTRTGLAPDSPEEKSVTVWPNPFQNEFVLKVPEWPRATESTIQIIDSTGKAVPPTAYEVTAEPGIFRINFTQSSLAPGVYLLTVSANGKNEKRKFKLMKI